MTLADAEERLAEQAGDWRAQRQWWDVFFALRRTIRAQEAR